MATLLLIMLASDAVDPITAFLTRDWAALGGWSLFIGLCLFMVVGSIREWWVPGTRYKRLEEASIKLSDANDELRKQNGQLITNNEITSYFFKEVPTRGEMKRDKVIENTES